MSSLEPKPGAKNHTKPEGSKIKHLIFYIEIVYWNVRLYIITITITARK